MVEIEEHGRGRVAGVGQSGCCGDVLEVSMPIILEHHIAATDGRDVEIRVAVVVDIRKRDGYADLAGNGSAGGCGDVFELSTAKVPPQLIAAHLTDKVDV